MRFSIGQNGPVFNCHCGKKYGYLENLKAHMEEDHGMIGASQSCQRNQALEAQALEALETILKGKNA